MKTTLKPGKLDHDFLKMLITHFSRSDKNIIIPPGVGLDAAGLKIGTKLVAITTDPITFSADKIATYSVAVNINDVACLGCKPRWYLGCLLLPIGTKKSDVVKIFKNLRDELNRYGVKSIGGHVEVTTAVKGPIIVGQMIGEAIGDNLLTPQNGRAGDKILLWNGVAIEGTALIAHEKQDFLRKYFAASKIKKMQKLLHNPGICIWPLVKKLVPCKGLVALHDITEGGVATALHELADASKCGVMINHDAISILPETLELSKVFKFNPLGLLASGSALILCRESAVNKIIAKIGGTDLKQIGELTGNKKRIMFCDKSLVELPRFDSDEIVKVLARSHAN